MNPPVDKRLNGCLHILQLELEVRQAASREALAFLLVNRVQAVLPAVTVLLWIGRAGEKGRIEAASGIAEIDGNAPFIRWIRPILARVAGSDRHGIAHIIADTDLNADDRRAWREWSPPHALWCPLADSDGFFQGGLWLVREQPWQEGEIDLAQRLGEAFAQRWALLERRRAGGREQPWSPTGSRRRQILLWGLLLLAMAFLPVEQSVLAPATVVAREPMVMTAPQDGVIDRIEVTANTPVQKGQVLFRLQQAEIRNRRDVAEMALRVARAKRLKAQKRAFTDADAKAVLPLLTAQIEQRYTEFIYAKERLEQTVVRAENDGIAIFGHADDWRGEPVGVGERVMVIADPRRVELEIRLPVNDALLMEPGAEIRLFLNTDPLHPRTARLHHAGFEAETTPEGQLAYRLTARFTDTGQPPPRIGLQGTAKISGEKIPLFQYLFRRPLVSLRQTIGF